MAARETCGRAASLRARTIDRRDAMRSESGGAYGSDAGAKISGRKRHRVTETRGHLVDAMIPTADCQDRAGAPLMRADTVYRLPQLRHIFADGAQPER